jgi:Tol biopolymer transport system component
VAAAGGEVVPFPVASPHQPLLVDVSRDGADLLVVLFDAGWFTPGELWIVPALGGAMRRVGNLRANYAVWSPDGRRLALTKGTDLLIANADGTGARNAWSAPGFLHSPAWSPDGHRVRVSVKEDQILRRSSLWEVDANGQNAEPLLPRFELPACCGRWTSDGAHFVFEAGYRRGDLWVLPERSRWRMKPNAVPARLTEGAMQFFSPQPSRDGATVFAVGWKPQAELVRYDAASGHFVPFLSGASIQELDFSRDGQWIVYTTYPEATLWRSRVDGRDRLQLTTAPLAASVPRLSPDGNEVVFTALAPGHGPTLHVMPVSGGTARPLIPGDEISMEASWSPDGRTLAVGVMSGERRRPIAIELVEPDRGRRARLTGSEGLTSPRFSPDGRYLAALSDDASRLLLHEVSSGRWRVLASGPRNSVAWPNWSRDGRHLFFDTSQTFERVSIASGRRETLARFGDLRRAMYHFGIWSGVTPEGSPLTLRNVSVNEVFALTWDSR